AGIPSGILDGNHHPCPKCDGKDRFRLIDRKTGGVLCNQCFNEKNGDYFDAVRWMKGVDFPEALQMVKEYLQVTTEPARLTSRKESAKPAKTKQFDIHPSQTPGLYDPWCQMKGVSQESFRENGGVTGDRYSSSCVGFPAFCPGDNTNPVRWILYDRMGGTLKTKSGDSKNIVWTVDSNSPKAMAGSRGLKNIASGKADTIFKVEGITDLLKLDGIIIDAKAERYAVITNSNGCNENPTSEIIELFRGKTVIVIGDADTPGQNGAEKWASAIASVAKQVKNVQLPFDVTADHGKDLRDYFFDGHSFDDLLQLVESAEVITPAKPEDELHELETDDIISVRLMYIA
ncbi:MAG: primase-helicase zinc-binding domain-containing protein, partial [Thermoguttaceae bacterium]